MVPPSVKSVVVRLMADAGPAASSSVPSIAVRRIDDLIRNERTTIVARRAVGKTEG
jgi:hypothetical protein